MAKKDIILRYAQAENEYLDLLDTLKDFENDFKSGVISRDLYDERVSMIADEVDKIKLQYMFWAEAIFELNKPAKKGKKMDDSTLAWYNELHTETKKALKDENNDALKTIKNLMKDGRL